MSTVGHCRFGERATGQWQCQWCKRTVRTRRAPKRNCYANPDVLQESRIEFETDIATDITPQTRTMIKIRQTLDKCFGGCRHMKRWCTKRGNRQLQEQYQTWIEYLLENDCTET